MARPGLGRIVPLLLYVVENIEDIAADIAKVRDVMKRSSGGQERREVLVFKEQDVVLDGEWEEVK